MRGVDLLLKKPGIDPEKIILLGSVAGGGDPAAVTAALDPRIKCLVPFNFGGPQPETKPLGDDAEASFNYAGSGSWESTRNLRDSVRDDFLPWVIVASTAPRHLIYAHEFSWYADRDPVYKSYQKIWSFYDAKDRVAFTHGFGTLTSKDPMGSHCNNIGLEHRKLIHPALERWFGIKAVETKDRRPAEELQCWTEEARKELKPKLLLEILAPMAKAQIEAADRKRDRLTSEELPDQLRLTWKQILGKLSVPERDFGRMEMFGENTPKGCSGWRFSIRQGENWDCTNLLLLPSPKNDGKRYPIALLVSRQNMWEVMKANADLIAGLIHRNIVVCILECPLPGSTSSSNIGRVSSSTSLSSSEQMLGTTLLSKPLRDLQETLQWLRKVRYIDGDRIALVGVGDRPANPSNRQQAVPHDAPTYPNIGDPFGGMLAAFGALYEPKIKAVAIRGSVLNLRSALDSPFVYLPHDALIPDAIRQGDLDALYGALAPRPLRFEGMIDSLNRQLDGKDLDRALQPIKDVYDKNGRFPIEAYPKRQPDVDLAAWITKMLTK